MLAQTKELHDYLPLAIVIGVFLLSLLVDSLLISRRRYWLGYLLGLLPIYAFWQILLLQVPRGQDCRTPLSCEWSGPFIFLVTGISLLMVLGYSGLALGMVRLHRKLVATPSFSRAAPLRRFGLGLGLMLALAAASCLGGYAGKGAADLAARGVFVRWRSLGKPAESSPAGRAPAERVVRIEFCNPAIIQVATSEGRSFYADVYRCLGKSQSGPNCWAPGAWGGAAQSGGNGCWEQFVVASAPGGVVERADAGWCGPVRPEQSSYVVLQDGSVWVWHHRANYDPFVMAVTAVVPGAIVGLVLGVVLLRSVLGRGRGGGGHPGPLVDEGVSAPS